MIKMEICLCNGTSTATPNTLLLFKSCFRFFPDPSVSSTNKTDRHNIAEILLKVALNTIKQSNIKLCFTCKERCSLHTRARVVYLMYAEHTPLRTPKLEGSVTRSGETMPCTNFQKCSLKVFLNLK